MDPDRIFSFDEAVALRMEDWVLELDMSSREVFLAVEKLSIDGLVTVNRCRRKGGRGRKVPPHE